MERRAQSQPELMRPEKYEIEGDIKSDLDKWEARAKEHDGLVYKEYGKAEKPVVLGDQLHESHMVAFNNAPQSLRELEEEVDFET